MAVIVYRGKAIIPGGFLTFNKTYETTGDGEKIGSIFNITLTGTLVAFKGSPDSTGSFWTSSGYPDDESLDEDERLKSILKKQEALRELFAVDGGLFEVNPWDGSAPLQFNPRVKTIAFSEGIWFDRSEYVIEMEADIIRGIINEDGEDGFDQYISEASESWSMEFNEQPQDENFSATYILTHTVEAVGKRFYNEAGALVKPAWQQARDWVQPRLGLDSDRVTSSGVLNLPGYYQGYNHARTEQTDEVGGTYTVTETWILASGSALEDFTISVDTSNENGLTQVSVQGNIEGLETRTFDPPSVTSKYTRALAKFSAVEPALITRAEAYASVSLNVIPLSKSIGRNPVTGNINYSITYDNRPINLIANTLSENIVVTDTHPADVFASIFVLGKPEGPVLQDLGTVTARQRELSVEVVMEGIGDGNLLSGKPNYDPAIVATEPAATHYKASDIETWDSKTKRGSRRITWVWT